MSASEGVITQIRQGIGEHQLSELGEITSLMIRRYAWAIGDDDPLHHDRAHAQREGFAGIVAPPNMVLGIVGWGDGGPEEGLRLDGSEVGQHLPGIPSAGIRLMGGGEEAEFLVDVVEGMIVTQDVYLEEVEVRESKEGPMAVLAYRFEFLDQFGTVLVRTKRTMLVR